MTRRAIPLLVLLAAALGGCGGKTETVERRTPMPITLPGVYAGRLPCSNCTAIEATLWLRPDGHFFLRQRFTDDPSTAAAASNKPHEPSATYGLGRWHWDELEGEAVLRGAGPQRRLAVRDGDSVELRVPSPLPHVLERDIAAPPFGDRVVLDGESAVNDKGATFKECLTGRTLTVADAGAYRELRRQHRRMNPRGKIALTAVEGHLVNEGSTASERLVVDRFIAIKPGTGC